MRRLAIALATMLLVPLGARAAVELVDDEVVFRLRAPDAKSVFLIGDFNNWNATVEPMPRVGDTFEISLFLVEGRYRYKFVVDGEQTDDPDNPGVPGTGSLVILAERAGGMVLSTRDESEATQNRGVRGTAPVQLGVRYLAELRDDPAGDASFHRADLNIGLDRDNVTGRAVLATDRDVWRRGPGDARVRFDRGRIAADVGSFTLTGFENDTVWTPDAPIAIGGNEGVFNYNPGFARNGIAMETQFDMPLALRLRYSDAIAAPDAPVPPPDTETPAIPPDPYPSAYFRGATVTGADQFVLEGYIGKEKSRAGYTLRTDRGLFPGITVAGAGVDSVTFAGEVSETTESRRVSVFWVGLNLGGVDVDAAWGGGTSRLDRHSCVPVIWHPFEPRTSVSAVNAIRESDKLATSRRGMVRLSGEVLRAHWSVAWDRTTIAFDNIFDGASDARLDRLEASVSTGGENWGASLSGRSVDQDYAATPDEFHFLDPGRNMWLDRRDGFTVADIAAFGETRYVVVDLSGRWEHRFARVTATVVHVAADAFRRQVVNTATTSVAVFPLDHIAVQLDGRQARYYGDSRKRYVSGFAEVRWMWSTLTVGLGWGQDRDVFDPVTGDYESTGVERILRRSVTQGVRRGDADAIRSSLIEWERALRDAQTIKLECRVSF